MTGYAHPIAFKAITDEHILKKEQFVAEKTLQILQQNLHDSINEKNCDVLIDDDELHDYFGDLYAQNPASFKFGPGDVLLTTSKQFPIAMEKILVWVISQ